MNRLKWYMRADMRDGMYILYISLYMYILYISISLYIYESSEMMYESWRERCVNRVKSDMKADMSSHIYQPAWQLLCICAGKYMHINMCVCGYICVSEWMYVCVWESGVMTHVDDRLLCIWDDIWFFFSLKAYGMRSMWGEVWCGYVYVNM